MLDAIWDRLTEARTPGLTGLTPCLTCKKSEHDLAEIRHMSVRLRLPDLSELSEVRAIRHLAYFLMKFLYQFAINGTSWLTLTDTKNTQEVIDRNGTVVSFVGHECGSAGRWLAISEIQFPLLTDIYFRGS